MAAKGARRGARPRRAPSWVNYGKLLASARGGSDNASIRQKGRDAMADQPPGNEPKGPIRFSAGARIGPYTLLQPLGRGGFGEVWLAERQSDVVRTQLALKLSLDAVPDLDAIRREADLWVKASDHPNVLPLFEANSYDG